MDDDLRGQAVTVIGAGAIGGTVGAFMSAAGYDVTLVDVVPEHVRAIEARGLRIVGCRGDRIFRPRAVVADEFEGPLGLTFLCVKGHFTEDAIRRYAPLLADDGCVVSLQNGLNEPIVARYVGAERTVGAFVHFGADYLEPGLIQLGDEQTIYVGELDGRVTARTETIRHALSHVMPARTTENIWGFLWGKLVYAAMAFTASCVDAPVPAVLDDPRGLRLCRAAAAEANRVAATQAPTLEQIGEFDPNAFAPGPEMAVRADAALRELREAMRASIKQHMGIWRDLKVKRRKTEVDMQIGVIVSEGREQSIPTPVNAAVIDVIHDIEAGRRGMEWSNLATIAARAGV